MNIILGITGGIAAYKTPHLVRLLTKNGHQVKVIMTENASEFVTPLTLATVSKNEVISSFQTATNNWNNHIELALWADVLLIAPLTANTLAKMASGICDNILLAVYFSAKCQVVVAPAMDLDMYAHPTVSENLKKLQLIDNQVIMPTYGELASGLVGQGRMEEPENIVSFIENLGGKNLPLKGKKVLITAGPTYELIDPVRFIGNFSTGKMGIALANECVKQGAEVTLILGPSSEGNIHQKIDLQRVTTASQMYEKAIKSFENCHIAILSAAVADFKPKEQKKEKIKKTGENLTLELVKNPDILASLGQKKTHQTLIGFALETNNELENAKKKLTTKNLDGIVLNSLSDKGAGFGTSTNKITFITAEKEIPFELKEKTAVAIDIIEEIKKIIHLA